MGHSVVGFVLASMSLKGRARSYYVYAVHNKLSEELYTVHKTP